MFKWVVEIEVAETWVADGFDMTPRAIELMLCGILPYAYSYEFKGRVIDAPDPRAIRVAQGYKADAETP